MIGNCFYFCVVFLLTDFKLRHVVLFLVIYTVMTSLKMRNLMYAAATKRNKFLVRIKNLNASEILKTSQEKWSNRHLMKIKIITLDVEKRQFCRASCEFFRRQTFSKMIREFKILHELTQYFRVD